MMLGHRYLARWEALLLVFLAAAFAFGTAMSEYFLTASNVSIAIAAFMPAAIVALAMTMIIVTGEIDISVGSIIGLCAAVMGLCLEQGLPMALAMPISVAVGALAGLGNEIMVAYVGLPSLVVTVATLALYRGIAQILLKERGVTIAVYLHGTRWGRALYAIGNNREAARFSGIDVKRTMLGLFVTSGVMCSVAAIILTAYLASARADTAVGFDLQVVTAVVLGGVSIFGGSGTLGGVAIALFVLAFVQNALGLAGVTPEAQQIATGGVLIVALIVFSAARLIRAKAAKRMYRRA